jgi:hypothetical protein
MERGGDKRGPLDKEAEERK